MELRPEYSAVPSWLDTDFFETTLRNAYHEKPDLRVIKVFVRPITAKGDNLGSALYRAVIDCEIESNSLKYHLIVKSFPTGDLFRQLVVEMGVFRREFHIYKFTLPAMHALLNKVPDLKESTFSARNFPTSRTDTLVLEDLNADGYQLAERSHQLDLQHCVAALRTLANFHALSIILSINVPRSMETFRESFYIEERREMIAEFLEPNLLSLADLVEGWTGFERFGDKLRMVASQAVDCIINVAKAKRGSIAVLNHGDFWVNNILFKYNDYHAVTDVKIVDFQSCRYASPALDLQYFIYTSPDESVRTDHLDLLLREYHASLGSTLGVLGYGDYLFSMDQLRQEMKDKAIYGLVSACTDLGTVLGQQDCGENSIFQRTFQHLLLHFEMNGIL
ncbi:uncharacterized protein [Anabrus simplex]|uniref:uncharacterized protein n=1 Tax=Anabrus simplex TaxID=316456 RepID=UPI0035A38861